MVQVLKRPLALSDLSDIWSFIADDSERQADRFADTLEEKFALLATQPLMGRERSELGQTVRSLPFKRYVIFYRPITDGIEIVRVLHSARDVTPSDFDDDGPPF
jgi:toxin ParE1/3/4